MNNIYQNTSAVLGAALHQKTDYMGVDFFNMDTIIVIMLKDKETGFLEKELSSITLEKNDEFILNVFACEEADGIYLHIRLTTDRDVSDWEYNAILDFYDTEVFGENVLDIFELDDSYNPAWEAVIKYTDDEAELLKKTEHILELHKNELYDVYNVIADKESEYNE